MNNNLLLDLYEHANKLFDLFIQEALFKKKMNIVARCNVFKCVSIKSVPSSNMYLDDIITVEVLDEDIMQMTIFFRERHFTAEHTLNDNGRITLFSECLRCATDHTFSHENELILEDFICAAPNANSSSSPA